MSSEPHTTDSNRLPGTAAASEAKHNKIVRFLVDERSYPAAPFPKDYPLQEISVHPSKRNYAARALDVTGCGELLRRLRTWRGVLILNYHRVGYSAWSDLDRNLWSATPESFGGQMASLKASFDVITMHDLAAALADPRGRYVMITFDDGYRDNYERAYPVLKEYGLSATFFLTTGFLDKQIVPWWDEIAWMVRNSTVPLLPAGKWFDEPLRTDQKHWDQAITRLLRLYKKLSGDRTENYLNDLGAALHTGRCPAEVGHELWMTWDMVREMKAGGMTFGGHTVNHPVLANLPAEDQDYEVRECRRRLVAELGEPIDAFSYPVGGKTAFNEITQRALERHQFRWGFCYQGGYHQPGQFDRYALRRTAIEPDIDVPMFRALTTLPQFFA